MARYPIPGVGEYGTYISLGSTTYPATFEELIGVYSDVLLDIDISYTAIGVGEPTDTHPSGYSDYFAYLTYVINSMKGSEGEILDISKIIDGTIMQGGVDATVKNIGHLTPKQIYTDNNKSLEEKIFELGNEEPPILPADVNLYLQYDGNYGEWNWVKNAGLVPPAPEVEGGDPTTEFAVPTWADNKGTGLLNTAVFITEDDEMYGQGVKTIIATEGFTLDKTYRGQVIKFPSDNVAGGDIKVPDTVAEDGMVGFQCVVINAGTGTVRIIPDTTNTLEYKLTAGDPALNEYPALDGQHSAASIIKTETDTWGVYGDLEQV